MIFDLKPVLGEWLVSMEVPVATVLGYREVTKQHGYCDSCWYESWEVEIDYIDNVGNERMWTWYGTFGALVKELTGG